MSDLIKKLDSALDFYKSLGIVDDIDKAGILDLRGVHWYVKDKVHLYTAGKRFIFLYEKEIKADVDIAVDETGYTIVKQIDGPVIILEDSLKCNVEAVNVANVLDNCFVNINDKYFNIVAFSNIIDCRTTPPNTNVSSSTVLYKDPLHTITSVLCELENFIEVTLTKIDKVDDK